MFRVFARLPNRVSSETRPSADNVGGVTFYLGKSRLVALCPGHYHQ